MSPDGSLDYDENRVYKRFYGFQGIGRIGGTYGFFSVNIWTGDVWSGWACKRISNPAVKKSKTKSKKASQKLR